MDALERSGLQPFELEWANSLRSAKQQMETQRYELILLDLNLGDSFGLDTLSEIAPAASDSTIIVVSGSLHESQEECEALGANAFLSKDELSEERLRVVLQTAKALSEEPLNDGAQPTDANNGVVSLNTQDVQSASLNRIGLIARLNVDLAKPNLDGQLLALHFSELSWSGKVDELRNTVITRVISHRIEDLLNKHSDPATLAHMGKGEFCVWLPQDDRFSAEKLAEHLVSSCKVHSDNGDLPELRSMQVGIAGASYCREAFTLIERARQALNRASRFDLDYSTHTSSGVTPPEQRDQLQTDLESSLSKANCEFQISPIIDLSNKQPMAASATVHWHLPGHQPLADADFHRVSANPATAQRSLEIICKRLCSQLKQWSGERSRNWSIQLPLSKHILRSEGWGDILSTSLKSQHVNPRQAWLSIKESDLLTASSDTKENLAKLNAEGYVIVVDDYEARLTLPAELQMYNADVLTYDARKLAGNSRLLKTVSDNAQRFSLMIRNLKGADERKEALEHGFRYGEGFIA